MVENTLVRRIITIPVVGIAFVLTTLLLPVLMTFSVMVDLIRFVAGRIPAVASRSLLFAWTYLLGEVWAIACLGLVGLLGKERTIRATYRLQQAWTEWNLAFLRLAYRIDFDVEGSNVIGTGPMLVFARHASLIDSLLPARFIANAGDLRLRYVLKRELLLDPALDIAGNRLPNYFVDRSSRESDAEVSAIRQLGSEMAASEGVVIFPEGTRYTAAKLERLRSRFQNKDSKAAERVKTFRNVLPPRLRGSLALLDSTDCDVVVLAHHGLEGLSGVADVWSGSLVGSTISVGLWRIPRAEVPLDRAERADWLFEVWGDIDDWISRKADED